MTCFFFLFEVTFLMSFSLTSKSVCFRKSTTSFLLAKFTCFNLAAKFSYVNLLNSGVVMYNSWSGILFLTSPIFVFETQLVTNLLTSGFLNSPIFVFNPQTAGGDQFNTPCGFSKNLFSEERVKLWFLLLLIKL